MPEQPLPMIAPTAREIDALRAVMTRTATDDDLTAIADLVFRFDAARDAEPVGASPLAQGYFSFDPGGDGFTAHDTADAAEASAAQAVENCRNEAVSSPSGEWPEGVERICWGAVLGRVVEVDREDEDGCVEYGLHSKRIRPTDSNSPESPDELSLTERVKRGISAIEARLRGEPGTQTEREHDDIVAVFRAARQSVRATTTAQAALERAKNLEQELQFIRTDWNAVIGIVGAKTPNMTVAQVRWIVAERDLAHAEIERLRASLSAIDESGRRWKVLQYAIAGGRPVAIVAACSVDAVGVLAHWWEDPQRGWMLTIVDTEGSTRNGGANPVPQQPPDAVLQHVARNNAEALAARERTPVVTTPPATDYTAADIAGLKLCDEGERLLKARNEAKTIDEGLAAQTDISLWIMSGGRGRYSVLADLLAGYRRAIDRSQSAAVQIDKLDRLVLDISEQLHEERDEALAKVKELEPFAEAVRSMHPGYDPELRAASDDLKEPANPRVAVQELIAFAVGTAARHAHRTVSEPQPLRGWFHYPIERLAALAKPLKAAGVEPWRNVSPDGLLAGDLYPMIELDAEIKRARQNVDDAADAAESTWLPAGEVPTEPCEFEVVERYRILANGAHGKTWLQRYHRELGPGEDGWLNWEILGRDGAIKLKDWFASGRIRVLPTAAPALADGDQQRSPQRLAVVPLAALGDVQRIVLRHKPVAINNIDRRATTAAVWFVGQLSEAVCAELRTACRGEISWYGSISAPVGSEAGS